MIQFFEGEKIILERRRHWYVLFIEGLIIFVLAISPFFIFLIGGVFPQLGQLLFGQMKMVMAVLFFLCLWWQWLWIIFFIFWTNYYLDVIIVTDKRIIDIEQRGLFNRDQVIIHLKNIQDIKVEVFGILATLLKFGSLHIHTAGATKELLIEKIPKPHEIKNTISELIVENYS